MEREIRVRGVTNAPIKVTQKQIDEFILFIGENTRHTTFALTFDVLNEVFGFGEKRLNQFASEFNKRFKDCTDLDFMGEHYVTLADFAKELKDKYKNLILDIERIEECQENFDKGDMRYHNTEYLDGIINTLKAHGYKKSADFLEKKKLYQKKE